MADLRVEATVQNGKKDENSLNSLDPTPPSKQISKGDSRSKEGRSQLWIKDRSAWLKGAALGTDSSGSKGLGQIIRDTSDTGNPKPKGHDASNLTPKELYK